ncbi:hypothetical protein [Roseicyclus sp.]|uniref:hypothetical protein n=1 Tax=Roseicyclus sp. TaxID=1914329 RepID=UPI003FA0EB36
MTPTEYDDTVLMAYADGALDADAARRIEAAAKADPEIAARIDMFRQTGALLGALGAAREVEPLPDTLVRNVEQTLARARSDDTVVAFPRPRPTWRPAALAASLALVAGALGGIVATLSWQGPETGARSLTLLDTAGLAEVLDSLPAGASGPAGDGEVTIIASFLTGDGAFCRELELDVASGGTIVSVACREDDAWTARFAMVTQDSGAEGYAPASALATLDAFLGTIGAGAPLSPEEEATRLSPGD